MTRTGYSATVTAPSILALIIQPDGTHEIREVDQSTAVYRQIVGGEPGTVNTQSATFWNIEGGKEQGLPFNSLATYLWWKLQPEMEAVDMLCGTVVVTGPADEAGDSDPVPSAVLDLFGSMAAIRSEWVIEGQDPEEGHAP
ncbi:hypothetical protein SEA_NANOSMITE_2 [Mycobacterium phage Nanosmite]|nr:hypothetical protein SEA_NANOSMITE_2 [Mycobacterium phage Nanosmite]